MESICLHDVISAVKGKCLSSSENIAIKNISSDSRKIKEGDLFIALPGETYDGHDFIHRAVEKGAVAVIASQPVTGEKVPLILVEDTGRALRELAAFYRRRFNQPVIAVTGSVGKTSTKEMISAILSEKFHVLKSQANFNNQIGLPCTVLQMEDRYDVMVLEMGMRGLGEIRELTAIARPSIGVITNIGLSHLGRLGSRENILRAKLEIVEGMDEEGVLILNANDPFLSGADPDFAGKIVYVGVNTPADYTAYDIVNRGEEGIDFKVDFAGGKYEIHLPALGEHHITNALCGIACAARLGLSPDQIIAGAKKYSAQQMRCSVVEKNGIKFINDCYNASPDSVKAALEILHHLAGGKRAVVIMGNIFELGDMAAGIHYQVGKMLSRYHVDFTAIMGENAQDVARGIGEGHQYHIYHSHEEIVRDMKKFTQPGDVILIKGSRGMEMEKILELW